MLHSAPYAKAIENSRRLCWETERDIIRGRTFSLEKNFLPAGLSLAAELEFLAPAERRLFSQVQGRSYAHLSRLVERLIGTRMLQSCQAHARGNQVALEALVRFTGEALKHQAMFARLAAMMAAVMPAGHQQAADLDAVDRAASGRSRWAVLALACLVHQSILAHYRASVDSDVEASPLWKDVFLFHWRDESHAAVVNELEWFGEDEQLDNAQREAAVTDLIGLVGALDGILRAQAGADVRWFLRCANRSFDAGQCRRIDATLAKAYRWQHLVSGVMEPRWRHSLGALVGAARMQRIQDALRPLLQAVPRALDSLALAA